MTSRDLKLPEVTRKLRHLTGSHLEVAVESQRLAYTMRFTSYNAAARRRMQSRDGEWRHVTSGDRKWHEVTAFYRNLEVAVEGWKLGYTVRFTSYKAVACRRRQSHDMKWRHVIWNDRKWCGSDVIWPEVAMKWLYVENCIYCVLHFLQGFSSQEEAVRWQ